MWTDGRLVLFLVFLGVSVESLDHMDQVQIKMPLSWLRPTTAMFHTDQSPALLCVFILRVRVVLHVLLHLEKTHTHTHNSFVWVQPRSSDLTSAHVYLCCFDSTVNRRCRCLFDEPLMLHTGLNTQVPLRPEQWRIAPGLWSRPFMRLMHRKQTELLVPQLQEQNSIATRNDEFSFSPQQWLPIGGLQSRTGPWTLLIGPPHVFGQILWLELFNIFVIILVHFHL